MKPQRCILLLALLGQAAITPALARSPNFFKGKTLTLVISSSAGGGYDTLGRLVAHFLSTHLPVSSIVVRNMPGAGGIVATNYLYREASKDGLTIGLVQNNTPFEPLYGTKQADYDARKFNWLGSPSTETSILIVWRTSPVNTIQDVMKRQITVASSGEHSTPSFYARLLNKTLKTKMKIVVGYPGQSEAWLAMERGEVDGYPTMFYSSLMATHPDAIKKHQIKLLVQYGLKKEPALPNVPFAPDLVKNPRDKLLLETGLAGISIGRPFVAPPGVPKARVAELRNALAATFADPKYIAKANSIHLAVNKPRSGPELARTIEAAYKAPAAVLARLRRLTSRPGATAK